MQPKAYFLLTLLLGPATATIAQRERPSTYLTVPGATEFTHLDTSGVSVLPSGRYVTPAGQTIQIAHDPFGMAVSPDGTKTVTLHNGVFTVIDNATLANKMVGWIGDIPGEDRSEFVRDSYKSSIPSPLPNGSFLGVAFGADNRTVYLSGGDNGSVIIYDIADFRKLDSISLNGVVDGVEYGDSFTSDLVYNAPANELLVLDRGNFRLVRIDLATRKITASIPTGRQPFGLALSPDHRLAFVANVGMYDYPLIPDITPANYDSMLIPWHPYGNDTKESIHGYTWKGRKIPGVGDPRDPRAMSVYTIDLGTNKVVDRYKPGYQIGQMIEGAEVVGGSSPNSLAVGTRFAYVTNATNDNISVIDYHNHRIVGTIPIHADPAIDRWRGLLPFGLTLSKDEKTLYVALLGFNAVAVIDVESRKTLGLIPSGWGPTRVALSPDQGTLYITSCRGYGAGPNGGQGFVAPVMGTYIGDIQLGTFQKVPVPDAAALAADTRRAIANTFTVHAVPAAETTRATVAATHATTRAAASSPATRAAVAATHTTTRAAANSTPHTSLNPLPILPGLRKSPIKYIVYITKENRSYDEVLGQLPGAKGDSTLARFGIDVRISGKDKTLVHMNVAPNHLNVARKFAFSDNYYCDSDASIHGHHWMLGVIPNEWVEANSSADRTAKIFSKASGRRFPGSTGSMDPEDYAERGGLWEAMDRSGVSFYNFGEANETAHNRESWVDTLTGSGHAVMVPMQKALWPRTSHNYAGFNTHIPDQFRVRQFETEFTRMWLTGKSTMPSLITIQLPNDHTDRPRPTEGYPFYHSYVADNDLALGRMLTFLSHTPYWKHMLVIITEDDPQGGVDHIDAHRSLLLLAGPYVKHGYISHEHANFGSILKMIYNILNVPYVNQYDATATVLQDFFTAKPDYTPYRTLIPSREVFDADAAMKKFHRNIDWRKVEGGMEMDDEGDKRTLMQTERPE